MAYELLNEVEWDQVNRVWDLLDEGQLERARLELDALEKQRPGHPDLRIVDAAVSLDEGEAQHALEVLKGAERSADPALFFHLRSVAHYELAQLEAARDDAERALAIHEDLGEAHDLLGRIYEHLGDAVKSGEHSETAHEIDDEAFPEPLEVSDEEFDSIVEACVLELPEKVRKHLDDLPVMVEPLPKHAVLIAEQPPLSPDILGLFVGRHLMERSTGDVPGAPGVIYLFRRNLLRVCSDRDELAKEIRITVQHEVGHLLGLDEDELEQWGLG